MSEFTERENAFIDGLVHVLEASNEALIAERAADKAMEENLRAAESLREEREYGVEAVSRYFTEAVGRSQFTEDDEVVSVMRDGLTLMQALQDELQALAIRQANANVPVL